MGRSKNDLIEAMNLVIKDMELPLKVIGLDFQIPEGCEVLPMDWVREGYKWLQKIYETEIRAWRKIRKSISEDQWKRYDAWDDCEDFQEVILMKEKNVALRKALVSRLRPDLFMKTKLARELKRIKRGNKRKDGKAVVKA